MVLTTMLTMTMTMTMTTMMMTMMMMMMMMGGVNYWEEVVGTASSAVSPLSPPLKPRRNPLKVFL